MICLLISLKKLEARINNSEFFSFQHILLDMASPLTAVAVVQGASRGLGLQVCSLQVSFLT